MEAGLLNPQRAKVAMASERGDSAHAFIINDNWEYVEYREENHGYFIR